jgi:hypothetical protein
MLSYRMSSSQTAAFDQGGQAATDIAAAISAILVAMTTQVVVVVDDKGIIAFVAGPSGGEQ